MAQAEQAAAAAHAEAVRAGQEDARLWTEWLTDVASHATRSADWLKTVVDYFVSHGFKGPQDLVGAVTETLPRPLPVGPQGAFLMRAIGKADALRKKEADALRENGRCMPMTPLPWQEVADHGCSSHGSIEALAHAMAGAIPPKKEVAKKVIQIGDALKDLNLRWLPVDAWPSQDLVDHLAEDCAKAEARKQGCFAFTFVDLAKQAMPIWAGSAGGEEEEEEAALCAAAESSCATLGTLANALKKVAKPAKKNLSMPQFIAAFHRWAVAAAVTGQLNYGSSQAHLEVCLRVADGSKANGRFHTLAVIYDELARKSFAEKTKVGAPDFNIDDACTKLDKDILARAEAMFDDRAKSRPNNRQSTGWDQKHWGAKTGDHQWHGKRQWDGDGSHAWQHKKHKGSGKRH